MRTTALAPIALAALLLTGCPQPDVRPGDARIVVPEVSRVGAASAGGSAGQNGTLPSLIASLDRADRAVAVVNANLDADPQDEQVVAVQRRDDPAAPVRLLVLDPEFPRGRGARVTWEAPTLAASARAFSLSVKDLVGDHGLQLAAAGTSSGGRFTLDVFRRAAADDLVFAPICQVIADEIEIEETPRTEAYSSGLKNGASWPVISWVRDPESGNPMDLVRIRWSWRPALNRYGPEPPEKVPGERVGQDQLRQLYADLRPAAFEGFLAGLWTQAPAPASRPAVVVQFDVDSRRIAINDGDTLESFSWRDTVRTLFDRIVVVAENEAVSRIRRTFSIRATDPAAITVSIRGDNEWEARELSLARLPDRTTATAGPDRDTSGRGVHVGRRNDRALRTGRPRLDRHRIQPSGDLGVLRARQPVDPDGEVPRRIAGNPIVARRLEGDARQVGGHEEAHPRAREPDRGRLGRNGRGIDRARTVGEAGEGNHRLVARHSATVKPEYPAERRRSSSTAADSRSSPVAAKTRNTVLPWAEPSRTIAAKPARARSLTSSSAFSRTWNDPACTEKVFAAGGTTGAARSRELRRRLPRQDEHHRRGCLGDT